MKKSIIILIAVFVAAVLARFLYSAWGQWMNGRQMKAGKLPAVLVEDVKEALVVKQFEAPARITSQYQVNVIARVSGYLTKSYFKEGDFVKKGQVLFEIEPLEYKLAADRAKAQLDNASAQLNYYNKQLIRYEDLVKRDYVSKSQYDSALSQRDSYKAQVAQYKSSYQDALRNYSYTKIKSPVDGQIGLITVTVGNYVNASAGTLTTINSNNPMYVLFPVDAKNFTELVRVDNNANVDRKVDLFFSDGQKYELQGIQNFHDNKVDSTTGTITMRATFDNPKGQLIHGNYAKIIIYSNEKEGVPIVPQTAVMENPSSKYVYKIDEKGLPQVQNIETSGAYEKNWIVVSGLKKGDKIITEGIQSVIPGNPVKLLDKKTMDEKLEQADKTAAEKEEKLEAEGNKK